MSAEPTSKYLAGSPGEETANWVTHTAAAALSVAALVILVVFSAKKNDIWRVVSFSIYGASLILLFLMSIFSHALSKTKAAKFFQIMDYSAIYFLIAGTYTPIFLIPLRGPLGWTLFGIVWALATGGVLFKVFMTGKYEAVSMAIYIGMGWLIVFMIKPLLASVGHGFLLWMLWGGLAYTAGTAFYLSVKMPFHHFIWHIFVLGGAACHFFAMLFYLV